MKIGLVGIIFLGVLIAIAFDWKNPRPIDRSQRTDYYIFTDKKQQKVVISSMRYDFDVAYVKNAQSDCAGPYFPAIHIKTQASHNAWLHLVRTDCTAEPRWLCFIDACREQYPFYSVRQDFSDNPLWYYSLFSKPLSFWIGHAYAVQVDHQNKTIECVGGISWGFRLAWWSLRPVMILPLALTQNDWCVDWKIFQEALPGYKNIEV